MTALRALAALVSLPLGMWSVRLLTGFAVHAGSGEYAFLPLLLIAPILTVVLILFAASGHRAGTRQRIDSAMTGGLIIGSACFFVGAIGPMVVSGGQQGPLLGFFLTGPLGFDAGAIGGLLSRRPGRRIDDAVAANGGPTSPIVRSILAVLVGMVVSGIVGNAIEVLALTSTGASDPNPSLAVHPTLALWLVLAGGRVLIGLAAGYVSARIAGWHALRHGVALAILQFAPLAALIAMSSDRSALGIITPMVLTACTAVGICAGAKLQTIDLGPQASA